MKTFLLARATAGAATLALSGLVASAQSAPASIRTISVGSAHACGVGDGGAVYCWGDGRYGQLGSGGVTDGESEAVRVASQVPFRTVSAGANHTCALSTSGELYCWGADFTGVLGDASLDSMCDGVPCAITPARVAAGTTFDSVSAGYEHSCALRMGTAYCWGRNDQGQLGRAPSGETCGGIACGRQVLAVQSSIHFSLVSARGRHTCGLSGDTAYCWGDNLFGQVGARSSVHSSARPVRVASAHKFVSLSSSGLYTCALTTEGEAACWGRLPANTAAWSPGGEAIQMVARGEGPRYTAVYAGGTHTCALAANQAVYCWGLNLYDRLGAPTVERCDGLPCSRVPTRVVRGEEFVALSVGGTGACALSRTSHFCWGVAERP